MSDPIEIVCDACDRSFPADPGLEKMPCPYCGDVNRIERADGPAASRSPGPTSSSAPPPSNEELLRTVRPALVRGHPIASLLSFLLLAGGLATVVLALTGGLPEWTRWIGIAGGLVGLGWSFWIFVLGHRWDRLKITDRRTIDERGIVMRSTSEVLHVHVRNLRITQTVWQRIMGIGNMEVDSAAGDGMADIRITNIPDPDGVKRLIDHHRGLGSHD
ncbi:MAG: PH domain-containing protein [Phycisphaera sp.]|nr:PH domain-containing protein [Phycisphaera sp.]